MTCRHGLGRTDLFYLNDPELSFREILRRHIAGEPLIDPAEKAGKKIFIKPKTEPEEKPASKKLRPDQVDIEIKDIKKEREDEKKTKETEEADAAAAEVSKETVAAAEEHTKVDIPAGAAEGSSDKHSAEQEQEKLTEDEAKRIEDDKDDDQIKEAKSSDETEEKPEKKAEEVHGVEANKTDGEETIPTDAEKEVKEGGEESEEQITVSAVAVKQEPMEVEEENEKATSATVTGKECPPVDDSVKENGISDVPSREKDKDECMETTVDKENSGDQQDDSGDSKKTKTETKEEEVEEADKDETKEKQEANVGVADCVPEDLSKQKAAAAVPDPQAKKLDEDDGINEVQVEIKDELKITIKLPAEKMNKVEVQVKGSPKFSIPETPLTSASTGTATTASGTNLPPPPTAPSTLEDLLPPPVSTTTPKCGTEGFKGHENIFFDTNNPEAFANYMNHMNPIRWPRDKAIQIRLEHIVHAVEKNEWPVSRFFSSASLPDGFDYTPQGTPDNATPVRDTPTPISECSDLAPPEDLIMSLPPQPQPPAPSATSANAAAVTSTSATGATGSRRGRRRRIAIDVETERAKLQALLSHSLHNPSILSHLPRGSANVRVQRESLQNPSDAENVSPGPGRPRHKFQPPPAHQHHPPSAASLLRSSHQQQNQTTSQQHGSQSRRETSHERVSRRTDENQSEPTNFSTRSQQSTLDLSVKSGNLSSAVAAAAMNALSSLSSVTVTPVTLGSPPVHGGSSSNSTPMDLSAR